MDWDWQLIPTYHDLKSSNITRYPLSILKPEITGTQLWLHAG